VARAALGSSVARAALGSRYPSVSGRRWRNRTRVEGRREALGAALWAVAGGVAGRPSDSNDGGSRCGVRVGIVSVLTLKKITTLEVLCLDLLIVRKHVGYCTYISVGGMTVGNRDTHMS
jgi:hypothetical protein